MIDFDKFNKKLFDKGFAMIKLDTNPLLPNWAKKFAKWWGYKLAPFLQRVASFLILVWLLNRVSTSFGVERGIFLGMAIIIFMLGKIIGELKEVNENKIFK